MKYDTMKLEKENFLKVYRLNVDEANKVHSLTNKPALMRWDSWLCRRINANNTAFICAYLNEDIKIANVYAVKTIDMCEQLFYGEWRGFSNKIDFDSSSYSYEYTKKTCHGCNPFFLALRYRWH